MPFIRQRAKFYLRKGLKAKNKTFYKDPLFCLGICSFIFLFGIIVFCPKLTIKSLSVWDFSFLTVKTSAESSAQNLFVEPVKNTQKDSLEIVFLQQNSAVGIIPPVIVIPKTLGIIFNESESFIESEVENRKSIIEYIVKPDDTLSSIAAKFDISTNTILWANNLSKSSAIKPGQKLIILPVSGVLYHAKKGDTLSEIAKKYKGEVSEIIAFNELSGESIFVGDILLIPNGQVPVSTKTKIVVQPQIPIGSSYFIYPTSSHKISQGLHWYNAVDFDGECGDPIYAAAGGTVQRVQYGWNGGGGNYITILHPNGVVTYYGHISSSLVKLGQEVSQGDRIALMGGKPGTSGAGRTTGCHVHFDVRGGKNPFGK